MNTIHAEWRTLFTLLNIPFTVNWDSWQFLPPKFMIGIVVALFAAPVETIPEKILIGILYGILLNFVLLLHIIGHILSSKFVSPAMTEARITPMLIQTRYDRDSNAIAPVVHLTRTIGGVLMNLTMGIVGYFIWQIGNSQFAVFFMAANFVLMIFVLLPLPTLDGEVIWREIKNLRRQTHD